MKSCATFIALGLTMGTAGWVILDTQNMLAESIKVTLSTPAIANQVPNNLPAAARLVQVANDLNIPHERLQALAQEAASGCDLADCIQISLAVWGPEETERAMREAQLASNR